VNPPRIAYLASEIPSASTDFVHSQIDALRADGVDVVPFSVHAVYPDDVPPDGRALLIETDNVYGDFGRLLLGFVHMFELHPLRTLCVLGTALKDVACGRFASRGQHTCLLVHAIAGLSLSPRLESAKVSHLHIHSAHTPSTVGMYAALGAGIGFSVASHAEGVRQNCSLIEEKIARAKAFVTASEAEYRELCEELGHLAGNIRRLNPGVDTDYFAPATAATADTAPVVFALGRLTPAHGFDLLIRAFAKVKESVPHAQLRIAGDGPQRFELAALAEGFGIAGSVHFFDAPTKREVRRELLDCNTFVSPSRVESPDKLMEAVPCGLIEAMACGVPVVTRPMPAIPELVEHEITGLLVNPENIDELAQAVARSIASDLPPGEIGVRARTRVREDFDVRRNTARLAALMLSDDSESALQGLRAWGARWARMSASS